MNSKIIELNINSIFYYGHELYLKSDIKIKASTGDGSESSPYELSK